MNRLTISHCVLILASLSLLTPTAQAAPANPHLAAFNKSLATWKVLKAKCGGNYSYKIRWSSFAGFGHETEITCTNNKVTQRKYRQWKGGPAIPQPVIPGRPAKPQENAWTETGDKIGSHKKGAAPKTLDELYLEARKVLDAKLSPNQKLYVRYDKQGLLMSCFYVDTRIADDAPRKGVIISSITLGKPDGDKAKAGKTIALTSADTGKTIKAAAGDIVTITLKANPTTGFIWPPVKQPKDSPLEFKSRKYATAATARPMVGQGGKTTFTYRVAKAGKATIALAYRRPWEKNKKPARTFTVTIEAAGATKAKPKPLTGTPEEKAAQWLKALGDKGLVLAEKSAAPGFAGRPITGRKSTMFVFSKPGWYLSLGFSGPITPDTPLATLKQKFKYIALNQLPTPGLAIAGWRITPQTPRSSFSEGVEFLSYANGKIKLRVKTKFFALYGRDTRVHLPADAPSPKGTYFQIRKPFPLDLTIEAPMAMKK